MIIKQAINITHADFTDAKVLSCGQLGVQVVGNTYLLSNSIHSLSLQKGQIKTQIVTCKKPSICLTFVVFNVALSFRWTKSPFLTNLDGIAIWDTGIIYNKDWTKL